MTDTRRNTGCIIRIDSKTRGPLDSLATQFQHLHDHGHAGYENVRVVDVLDFAPSAGGGPRFTLYLEQLGERSVVGWIMGLAHDLHAMELRGLIEPLGDTLTVRYEMVWAPES